MIEPISETSLEAFKKIRAKLPESRKAVYETLKQLGCATNMMIADKLGWSINRVTGRINELRNREKLVGYSHTAKCPITSGNAMWWRCVR